MFFWVFAMAAFGHCVTAEVGSRLDMMRYCLVNKGLLEQDGGSCSCPPSKEIVLDLGTGFYPRFLSTFECEAFACLPLFCSTLSYNVQVLRRREKGDIIEQALPESLKSSWKFVNIPVNVGCACNGNLS